MNDLTVNNNDTMTSLEIAELTGKKHKNVLVDIKKWFPRMYEEATYTDKQNRVKPMFILEGESLETLLSKYNNKAGNNIGIKENAALDTIEQLLGIKLIRQFKIGNYKLDGYHIESKTAYEIDESQHNSTQYTIADSLREKDIKALLGCTFKRIRV